MVDAPETRYAVAPDGVHVAYQVVGDGPIDLVFLFEWMSNLDVQWQEPSVAGFLDRLSSFSRLIMLNPRGTGFSDPVGVGRVPTVEEWMEDIKVVMDTVGSERAGILATGGGGPMSLLFAASHPNRVSGLALINSYVRLSAAHDFPAGVPVATVEQYLAWVEPHWGTGEVLVLAGPSRAKDTAFRRWHGQLERSAVAPSMYAAIIRALLGLDLRDVVSTISVPTLVVHRVGDLIVPVELGRDLASRISGATLVELAGEDHVVYAGDTDALIDEVEEFFTGVRSGPEANRVLATVLFTDMVGSTERAARVGDRAWRDIVETHHAAVRHELARFRGREIDTAGDGFFATFEGPARAIRAGRAIRGSLDTLGIDVRMGLHTGECEVVDGKLGGIAVNTGARIAALAGSREILVSRTVVDLVSGSGATFEDRGTHQLKGVPGTWQLFAVQ
jgi:class 3 adenylate cyclase